MPSTHHTRRHRNPHTHDEQHPSSEPFFSKAEKTAVQQKSEPFFSGKAGAVQAKLSIGQPGDQYEREADAVAEKVVSQPGSTPGVQQKGEISAIQKLATPVEDEKLGTNDARMAKDKEIQEKPLEGSDIQKMSAPEEEEPVQMMGSPEEEEPVQMVEAPEEEEMVQSKTDVAGAASPALSSRIEQARGKGKPLPDNTRTEMETSIGADFQGVRLHTDAEAVDMNRQLGAQAFTNGQDIYFNSGKYSPENHAGKRLLAHELTHVVQQISGVKTDIQRECAADGWKFEYDGCSVPGWLAKAARIDKDNPAGGKDTGFGAKTGANEGKACDFHDECYQTCDKSVGAKETCDYKMYLNMIATCNASKEPKSVKEKCLTWAERYYTGLVVGGGSAFDERQKQTCGCVKPQKKSTPEKAEGKKPAAPEQAQETYGIVTASALRVRTQPSLEGTVMQLYFKDSEVKLTCQTKGTAVEGNDTWYKTDHGYISGKYVTVKKGTPKNCS